MKKVNKALQIAKMAAGGMASPKPISQYPPFTTRQAARSFAGPIRGLTSGRGDKKMATVKAGSFVVPAHVLSALGKGNTEAGFRVMNSIFSGPGGFNAKLKGGRARFPGVAKATTTPSLKFADGGGLGDLSMAAAGDPVASNMIEDEHVPIQISDGEYVIPPEKVAEIGGGDIEVGHELLRRFSDKIKHRFIKDLKKIPGPK